MAFMHTYMRNACLEHCKLAIGSFISCCCPNCDGLNGNFIGREQEQYIVRLLHLITTVSTDRN